MTKTLIVWMQQHETGLRNYLATQINRADVDDLVQEVFIRIQLKQNNATIDNPRNYIFTVARNLLISRHRQQRIHAGVFHDGFAQETEIIDLISPERTAIGKQEYRRVLTAILKLPPRARTAFALHRFGEMSYRQVADNMDISQDSVKELIQRALMRIRRAVQD